MDEQKIVKKNQFPRWLMFFLIDRGIKAILQLVGKSMCVFFSLLLLQPLSNKLDVISNQNEI